MASFFLQFEKTLEDHDIPSRKWLQALQASLDGLLVDVYWDTFHQEERDTYEISKCTLMKWCVFSITECIQQVGVVRMKYSDTYKKPFKNPSLMSRPYPIEIQLNRFYLNGQKLELWQK